MVKQDNSAAKKYNNIKLAFGIGESVLSFILIFLFVASGYSTYLTEYLSNVTSSSYLQFLLFVVITGIIGAVIFAPFSYYTGYYLEHKYDLSNQTFWKWILEGAKGLVVTSVIGLPLLIIFFWVLNTFGTLWWLVFAVIIFLFSVVFAQIVPVIILPIFYKVTPLENEELKERILRLSEDAGMKVQNVFKFDMSKNTKKANAAFTGLGKTKRILLGDTLLESYDNDQIETVLAHEFGHYKHKHIVKNIFIGTFFSFFTFYLMAVLYEISLPWFGFNSITQIDAIPLLTLWAMLIGVIQSPVSNIISRKFEYQADEYAVSTTNKKSAFISTLDKLTEQNLGDRDPHPFVEWFFYSHPSIKNRIKYIESLKM
ncbi:MAG: M48 family metallopeptidase [Ignavibacteria bacterium]|jgi:STE24 endopeptidase